MNSNKNTVVSPSRLDGLRVVITRPAHQAAGLCKALTDAGALPLRFPTLAIELLPMSEVALAGAQIAIFTSVNAVSPARLLKTWQVCAIGQTTANALEQQGIQQILHPSKPQENSEGLLALPELQTEAVRGKSVLIFKGEGGRDLLETTLRKRGAMVTTLNVYRRTLPAFDKTAHPWLATGAVDVIVCTSGEGLRNLFTMLPDCDWLQETQFVLVSSRLQSVAKELNIVKTPLIAPGADDRSIIETLIAHT